jgi:hypothetical protein
MYNKIAQCGELLATNRALVWPVASMHSHVVNKSASAFESFTTHTTVVGLIL